MKKQALFLLVFITAAFLVHAQAPNAIPYQGVARNAAGNILASQPISLRISIHDVTATGTVVFSETHAVTTNTLGLFNVNIGSGTALTGTFTGVDWGNGAKFIQVEMDPAGGIAYADMGTTQLNSVPYALYAGNANSGNFVDLTTNQTIAGSKSFTSDLSVNGMRLGGDGGALFNTYFGTDALLNNQGSANTAVGMWALKNSTTTSGNTAVGTWALSENTTGGYNSAFGNAALTSSTIGTANTAIGQTNLGNNTTGSYNTALGHNSMMGNSTGNANTTLGSNADVGAGNLENASAIGFNAIVDASNKVQIGNGNVNAVQLGAGANVTLETGLVKLTGGIPGAGKVLTSDANGLASWQTPAATGGHFIGESFGGGIVFYVYDNGQHGLIAATSDQSTGIQWYNGTYTVTNAVRDGIGAGKFNTERIIANQGPGTYAAQICANYQGGNYGDWYLPSKYELNLLYLQKNVVGGFVNSIYWGSTELINLNFACSQNFTDGTQFNSFLKDNTFYVRAVRAF